MDQIRNPFAPGAGSQPPELVGRDPIISNADIAIQRTLLGRYEKSQILLGLRGTGKTVLLNKFEQLAEQHGHLTSFLEAPDDSSLADMLYPRAYTVLRKLSTVDAAKASAHSAMRALRSFASVFKVKIGDVSISVDPEQGTADSGDLELDLSDLLVRIGEAARSAGAAWTLLIDEIQYLSEKELSALIVAIHRLGQKQLPVLFFGAGLPQIAALSGNAKSYAERLFNFPNIGPLDSVSAMDAIRLPIENEGETITWNALDIIVRKTQAYPYFLQEWGYQAWALANCSPIDVDVADNAGNAAIHRLDEGFFRVRLERLTPKEKEYVYAMAALGNGPYRSADIAEELSEKVQALGPRRATIIRKGMIYSPSHGDIDFTVPLFAEFLRRTL